MPLLLVESGDLRGLAVEVTEELIVGRDVDAGLHLSDPGVSRHHCRVFPDDGRIWIEDMGSRNGTFVNGAAIERAELVPGSRILAGTVEMRFVLDSSAIKDSQGPGTTLLDVSGDREVAVSVVADASNGAPELLDPSQALLRLQTYYQVAEALATQTDEHQVLARILQCLMDIFPQASRAYVLMGDSVERIQEKGRLYREGGKTDSGATVSRTILRAVLERREAVLSTDAAKDQRFLAGASIVEQDIHTMMCAPLIACGEVLGVIEVDSASVTQPFVEADLNLLVGIARQIALFLRNTQLAARAATERAQRKQLERFFSPAVARRVADSELTLGGELREGVVMFCDIVGFTPMSEKKQPAELVELLNLYLGTMVEEIFAAGGTVDKFGGDAILAVWGAPAPVENDADWALRAALRMQNDMVAYNARLAEMGSDPVGMGIGLHAGPFIAGNIGSAERMEYTVIGNHVNLAQRVESKAAADMVVISEAAADRLSGRVLGTRFEGVRLKGAGATVCLICARGLITRDECLLSVPVMLDNAVPAKIIRADPEARQLVVSTGRAFGPSAVDVLVTPRTPELAVQPFRARLMPERNAGNDRDRILQMDRPAPFLDRLFDEGVIEGGKNGIPWRRES
ncbi:MAG: FHA domain-containing protein [Kiritimatiellaeota bacterium]|nr:FHA domain-containing protein [Kiritimatiellota bacterium]